ncbi:hypothetical protein BKA70DRAFT_1290035 [Coprinopsis sp. MPI-PUGE-AT-0042]|nr:hypothetical protein BKA70DRAFT_1290035 [Coprinopsis sp. MPI-PUGE-AT-0042]
MPIFRDIPLDVLGHIFTTYHQDTYSQSRPSTPWPEVTLSHVCRQWRSLALSSHFKNLWSVIVYDCWRLHDVERVRTYLQRSNPLPIEVTLKILRTPDRDDEEFPENIIDLVFNEVARWKTFTLVTSPGWMTEDGADAYEDPAQRLHDASGPLLESLSIINIPLDAESSESHYPRAPKLTSLHLTDLGVQYFLPPLSTIVELSLEGQGNAKLLTWDHFVNVILQLPTLRRLSVLGDISPGFEENLPEELIESTVEAPYLTHLRYDAEMDEEDETILFRLLPQLVAPRLEWLMLGNIMEGRSFGIAFTANQDDSQSGVVFPKLTTVVLHQCSYGGVRGPEEEQQWYAWLSRAAPGLERLVVVDCDQPENSIVKSGIVFWGIRELVYTPSAPSSGTSAGENGKDAAATTKGFMKTLSEFSSARQSLKTIVLPSAVVDVVSPGGLWDQELEKLRENVEIKGYATLEKVVPEAFVFRTPICSVPLASELGGVGLLEVAGKSIRGC